MSNQAVTHSGTLTLHHLTSSKSFRVLWALEELAQTGLQFCLKIYNRTSTGSAPDELKGIFPLGKSPILVFDPSQAEEKIEVVAETRLVLQYIADHYSDSIWKPESHEDVKRDTYWQEFANNTISNLIDFTLITEIVPAKVPWIVWPLFAATYYPISKFWRNQMAIPFGHMESSLTDEKPWFAGNKLGLADFNMIWPMDVAEARGYFNAKKYPKLAEWLRRVRSRPAYQTALGKGGVYDLVNFK